jgi:hypothetical protein
MDQALNPGVAVRRVAVDVNKLRDDESKKTMNRRLATGPPIVYPDGAGLARTPNDL